MSLSKEAIEIIKLKAIEYRQAKVSYRAIAKKLGISSSAVFTHVKAAMEEVKKKYTEKATHIVIMEMANLDLAEASLHNKIVDGDTAAIAALLRIQERRSKLIGLDAPIKQQIEMELPEPIRFVYEGK